MAANGEPLYPFSDLALARRLERTEARSNAEFVEARARLFPESGAQWIDVAGAYALFDGVSSPCTQTFGLGMFETVTNSHLEKLESFFRERGASVDHEVSPMADPSLLALLNERGYQPIELTSLLFRPIRPDFHLAVPRNERIHVRLVREDELEIWSQTVRKGWGATGELADFLAVVGRINAAMPSAEAFMAELDGRPIATGALILGEGVAVLAGASTIPEGRRQGAQLALLEARLRYAAEHGCDLAMMGALPGSASQRNAERHGFRIAYTRIKWRQVNRKP
jgi:hypothetical protein